MPPLSTARIYHHGIVLDQYVYVLGGKDASKKVTTSVERFAVVQPQWSSLPNLTRAVYGSLVISYGNKSMSLVVRMMIKSRCHASMYMTVCRISGAPSQTPEPWSFGTAVSIGRFIYLVEGSTRSSLRFDTKQWKQLSRPRLKHGNAPAVVWQ